MPPSPARICKTLLLAIVVLIALLIFVPITYKPLGRLAAQYDVQRGHYEVKGGGLRRTYETTLIQLLKERYGVVSTSSGGCFALPHQIEYAAGYNAVSKPAINKHFGKDVFAECREVTKAKIEEIEKADLTIIARPLSTTEVTDSLTVAGLDAKDFQALDTKLHVVGVLHGRAPASEITLHHFRYSPTAGTNPNCAMFLNFSQGDRDIGGQIKSATEAKDKGKIGSASGEPVYILYLKIRPDGNYEPVTGQYDAALSSREIHPEIVPFLLESR